MAGDNAIVVGMAAAGLPASGGGASSLLGIAAATVLRIRFAYFAVQLLAVIGLTLAGGVLLLWVCVEDVPRDPRDVILPCRSGERSRMLRRDRRIPRDERDAGADSASCVADFSMSLDNVLAVAGIARDHFWLLAFGLVLSVALMGVASTWIATTARPDFWISWVGLGIITFVALRMIWEGSTEIFKQTALVTLS